MCHAKFDDRRAEHRRRRGVDVDRCAAAARSVFYIVDGGGHTWPGSIRDPDAWARPRAASTPARRSGASSNATRWRRPPVQSASTTAETAPTSTRRSRLDLAAQHRQRHGTGRTLVTSPTSRPSTAIGSHRARRCPPGTRNRRRCRLTWPRESMRHTSSWPTKQPFVNETATSSSPASCGIVRLVGVEALARDAGLDPRDARTRRRRPAARRARRSAPRSSASVRSRRTPARRTSRPDDAARPSGITAGGSTPRTASAATGDRAHLGLHPDLEPVEPARERFAESALAHAPPRVGLDVHDVEVDEQLALRLEQQRVPARRRPPTASRSCETRLCRNDGGVGALDDDEITSERAWNGTVMTLRGVVARRPLQ